MRDSSSHRKRLENLISNQMKIIVPMDNRITVEIANPSDNSLDILRLYEKLMDMSLRSLRINGN